jgi:SNF2 family DNA or RNA helicase
MSRSPWRPKRRQLLKLSSRGSRRSSTKPFLSAILITLFEYYFIGSITFIIVDNNDILQGGKANNLPSLMNVMMQLRKCCNHPYLLEGVEEMELRDVPPSPEEIHSRLIAASGKLVLIDKLLPRLRSENHKVLIFSQVTFAVS